MLILVPEVCFVTYTGLLTSITSITMQADPWHRRQVANQALQVLVGRLNFSALATTPANGLMGPWLTMGRGRGRGSGWGVACPYPSSGAWLVRFQQVQTPTHIHQIYSH